MGRRIVTGVVAGLVFLGVGACADDGDGDEGAAADRSTTTAASTTSAAPATTTEPTTTTLEELDNQAIQSFVEDEHPDEAALVDWTTFRWVGFNGGYTAHVPPGTTVDEGVAVCEALSEIVYEHSDFDPIAVVVGAEETPLVRREGPDGTCAAG
jgi:hypothetical protein